MLTTKGNGRGDLRRRFEEEISVVDLILRWMKKSMQVGGVGATGVSRMVLMELRLKEVMMMDGDDDEDDGYRWV